MTDLIPTDRLDLAIRQVPTVLDHYLAGRSPGSRRTLEQSLRFIAEEFSAGRCNAANFPWRKLRYEHTSAIRSKLAERYAPATANKMLSALRGILKECWRLGQLGVEEMSKAADIQPIRGSRIPKGRALSDGEVDCLVMHTTAWSHQVMLRLMVQTGLRRSEVSALRPDDFIPGEVCIDVKGKGNKARRIPVPYTTWRHSLICLTGTGSPAGPAPFPSAGRIWQIIRESCFNAGIGMVTPHDLRRTYATKMLDAGADLALVQRLMGHSNPKTTAAYDRRGLVEARKAVNRIFPEGV